MTVRMRNGDDHWFGGMWSPVAASDAVWTAWKARAEHRASLALAARNALVSTRDVSELTKADLQIRSLRACLNDLEADAKRNSDAASALANAQARSERLKDEIELLSASITRLAAEHAEQRDLRVAEESKARELKLELEEERDLRRRAERKAADLAAECEEHRCRAEEHRAAREADARRADEARTRCADVELRGEELASSLRVDLERRDIELARVTSRLAETIQTLETERTATAAHAATAEATLVERDAAASERDSLRKKLATAEECVGELDAKLANAEAKLIAADAMNAELRAEADAAKKRAEALEKDLHRARGEAERARAAVKEGADEWKEAMAACTAAERDAAAARGAEALARETADKSRVALEESRARERAAREAERAAQREAEKAAREAKLRLEEEERERKRAAAIAQAEREAARRAAAKAKAEREGAKKKRGALTIRMSCGACGWDGETAEQDARLAKICQDRAPAPGGEFAAAAPGNSTEMAKGATGDAVAYKYDAKVADCAKKLAELKGDEHGSHQQRLEDRLTQLKDVDLAACQESTSKVSAAIGLKNAEVKKAMQLEKKAQFTLKDSERDKQGLQQKLGDARKRNAKEAAKFESNSAGAQIAKLEQAFKALEADEAELRGGHGVVSWLCYRGMTQESTLTSSFTLKLNCTLLKLPSCATTRRPPRPHGSTTPSTLVRFAPLRAWPRRRRRPRPPRRAPPAPCGRGAVVGWA